MKCGKSIVRCIFDFYAVFNKYEKKVWKAGGPHKTSQQWRNYGPAALGVPDGSRPKMG